MEPRRKYIVASSSIAWDEPECVAIRQHWPNLSGPDKLAWLYLWNVSRRGLDEISVTAAMVAEDQGTSGDAGLQRLKNLEAAGLLGDEPGKWDRKTGRWRIRMPHPFDVGWRIVRDASGPIQLQFDFLNHLERSQIFSEANDRPVVGGVHCDPEDGVTDPSPTRPVGDGDRGSPGASSTALRGSSGTSSEPSGASSAPSRALTFGKPSEITKYTSPSSTFVTPSVTLHCAESEVREDGARVRRGTSGGTSEADQLEALQRQIDLRRGAVKPPPSAAEVMVAVAARLSVDPLEQQRQAEAFCDRIMRAVRCKRLRRAPCIALAWEVVYGRIPWEHVAELLRRLRDVREAGTLNCPESAYLIGGRDRLYRQHGIPLPKEQLHKRNTQSTEGT